MAENLLSNLTRYTQSNEYVPLGFRDGHGGHGREHVEQMERIANEVFDKKLEEAMPSIYKKAYSAAYQQFCNDLTFDVTSCVQVAFENGDNIFKDKKTQKVVAEKLTKEILKQCNFNKTMKITL